jgi:hypothetical protein
MTSKSKNIFNNEKLYPNEEDSVLTHYSEFYNKVYISFLPFYSIPNVSVKDDYPEDEEIIKNGITIKWKEIVDNSEIENYKELNKALMTSISGLNKIFARQDLLKILERHTENENIWIPCEGTFDVITLNRIYKILKKFNLNKIVIKDEFYRNTKSLNLEEIAFEEFNSIIDYEDYYIYSKDKEILFAIDWDYFFFFIAFNESNIESKLIEQNFDGFWADENSSHSWCWEKEEVETILKKYNKIKRQETEKIKGGNGILKKVVTMAKIYLGIGSKSKV